MGIDKKFGIAVSVLVVLIALVLWVDISAWPLSVPLGGFLLVVLRQWELRLHKCPKCGGRDWQWNEAQVFWARDDSTSVGHYYCSKCLRPRGKKGG